MATLPITRRCASALHALGLWLALAVSASAAFQPPVQITSDQTAGIQTQLARDPQGSLLRLGADHLALVYFEGNDSVTTAMPARVFLREWNFATGWGTRQQVDHSKIPPNQQIGARHPAVVSRNDGVLYIAWHDHRNSTALHNWIDNLELYAQLWSGAVLQSSDTRLTQSSAGGVGDNGYNPRLARLPDGRLVLAWYDFNWDPSKSEICLRLSDNTGSFPGPTATMDEVRLTTAGTRFAGDETQPFTQPSIAVASNGLVHLCWVTGVSAAPGKLYRATYNPATAQLQNVQIAAVGVSGYFDPPRLIASPTTDTVYLLYHDITNGPTRVMRIRQGGTVADIPIQITPNGTSTAYPDAALAADGKLHIVYVNQTAHTVELRTYDPALNQISPITTLTPASATTYARPTLLLDGAIHYVAYEETTSPGTLWFVTDHAPRNAVRQWQYYE